MPKAMLGPLKENATILWGACQVLNDGGREGARPIEDEWGPFGDAHLHQL
jgi:hypothetical protein